MIDLPRAVVVQAGARDQYQVPIALAERGWLEKLVTEAYLPGDVPLVGKGLHRLLGAARVQKRFRVELPFSKVRLSGRALLAEAANVVSGTSRFNPTKDVALGRKARREAARTGAALVSFNTYAATAFAEGPGRPHLRLLFQMHPHAASVKAVLEEELQRTPEASTSLRDEYELSMDARAFEALSGEPALANGWIAASSHTADTLVASGLDRAHIHVVPYGIDRTAFPQRPSGARRPGPLRLIWVGSIVQRKGFSYLLDALEKLGPGTCELTVCGRFGRDAALLQRAEALGVTLRMGLSRAEVVAALHQADLFVLPSLTEGFAHVLLEAMSTGLPVLTTANTCAADLVVEGREGFKVPLRDPEALAERITWAGAHLEQLAEMGLAAARVAEAHPWSRFREGVAQAYRATVERLTR